MSNLRGRVFVATFSDKATDAIRDYGVGMEINDTCISEMLDGYDDPGSELYKMIDKEIADAGPEGLILHGPFTEIIPAAIDPHMKDAALARLDQAYRVCEHYGIRKMIVHNGWIPFMYYKSWQVEKGSAFWKEFMSDKPEDFEICIENVLEDEPYMLQELMAEINDPRIRICLDIGHAHAMTTDDYTVDDWIRVLSPYISHFHLHNNDGTGDTHSAFDDGTMDMESIFDQIDSYLGDEVTFTVEARPAEECLEWMLEHRLI